MSRITAAVVVSLVTLFALSILSRSPHGASAAPSDVQITQLSCDSSPEFVRIKNFGGSSQSLTGFHIQSDPASQDYLLTDYVSSIAAGQTLTFYSGTGSGATYTLTGSNIYRNADPTDYARLVRPGTTSHQVNCGSTPATPTVAPTASPTPTKSPSPTPTKSPTPTPTQTSTSSPTKSPTATPTSTATSSQSSGTATNPSTLTPTVTPTETATPTPTGQVSPTPTSTLDGGTATPTPTVADVTATPTGSALGLIWGDNNCSGEPDPVDSLVTLRFDAGLSTNTGDCPLMAEVINIVGASLHQWGDVDCSGAVNPVDSLKLLRYDAGLSVGQGSNCPEMGAPV